jgi:hypothetical protein
MANMASPLSSESILKHMADALPTHTKDDTSSDLSSLYEVLALFTHASMTAVGFRLVGFSEEKNIEEEVKSTAPRMPPSWNSSFSHYDFLYAHSQSQMKYLIQVIRSSTKARIQGIALGDERTTAFEITAKDYISASALPLRITMTDEGEDRADLEEKLKQVFTSPHRIQDLASEFKSTIIQKLMPGIHKEGYEEDAATIGRNAARDEREEEHSNRRNPPPNPLREPLAPPPARPYPFNDPLAAGPRRPLPDGGFAPPGFDDEYDLNRPLRGMAPPFPGAGSPFGIGGDDLNPPGLGPYDPLRPGFIGGGGGGNGGMHPTFDDPLFRGQGRAPGGFIPQAPPGSRYDPPFPGAQPPQGRDGRPPNPFGGFGSNDFI